MCYRKKINITLNYRKMKKLMFAAMMILSTSAAFAGDSDALKAIMKAKTYAEADALLKQNLSALATDAERAKAYNKLVDLALEKYNKESTVLTQNQMNAQMGIKGKDQAFDTLGMYNAATEALQAGLECDKYDQKPDAKGKVKPRFAAANNTRLWGVRAQLVNAGQEAAQKGKDADVLKYWGTFLDTNDAPLFASQDKSSQKEYFGQVALFTAQYAFQAKDKERAGRYCDLAMKDPEQAARALGIKLLVMRDGLKTKADSVKFVDELKALYAQKPDNGVVLESLANLYSAMGQKDAQVQLLDEAIAKNPKNFVALFLKGQNAITANNANEAIKYLKQAAELQPENALVLTYLGACLNVKAADQQDPNGRKVVYTEALKYLDKAKQLDPQRNQANWAYNRYQACYGLYGADAPETKAAEAESKN